MEKHKCKLCFRSFSNGRALGGHMRSHMMNLPIPPKEDNPGKLAEEADSVSSRSEQHFVGGDDDDDDEDDKSLCYGLRENPKRSIKLVDPEFSMMILQDRESETESSKNPTRRRSDRVRRPEGCRHEQRRCGQAESWAAEPEPASSISDATTEEDVAYCLMMMSRDNWRRKKKRKSKSSKSKKRSDHRNDIDEETEEDDDDEEEEEDDFENDNDEEEESEFEGGGERGGVEKRQQRKGGKYKCETCSKVFRSYQALGGHRASHKKIKLTHVVSDSVDRKPSNAVPPPEDNNKKSHHHQCPVCFRLFSSGQALGGHKRSHVIAAAAQTQTQPPKTSTPSVASKTKVGESLIDLNLPAPDYDDDDETSQVSDAEFVNTAIIRQ